MGLSGLALVLEGDAGMKNGLISESTSGEDAASVAARVIGAPAAAGPAGAIDFSAVAEQLQARLSAAAVEPSGAEEGAWEPTGRLGGDECAMVEVRGACSVAGGALLSRCGASPRP
jgi:hypothetical protein